MTEIFFQQNDASNIQSILKNNLFFLAFCLEIAPVIYYEKV